MENTPACLCFKIQEENLDFSLAKMEIPFQLDIEPSCSCKQSNTGVSPMIKLATKNTSYAITQGDNLRLLISSPEIPIFDNNWAGTWGLKTYSGAAELAATDQCVFSEDRKYLVANLSPEKTKDLEPREYILVLAVYNTEDDFRKQILTGTLTVTQSELPLN